MKFTLESARVYAGFTQAGVAHALHVSTATIINWEKGRTSPSVEQGKAISALYGVPFAVLFLGSESN